MTVATAEEAASLKAAILEALEETEPGMKEMRLVNEMVDFLCGIHTSLGSQSVHVLATIGISASYTEVDRKKIELYLNLAKRLHNGEVDDERMEKLEKQLVTKRVRIHSQVQLLMASSE